jgi:hypothetical protein
VEYRSVYRWLSAVRAVMQTRGATGPAPRRGLEGNRFAMLEHASVDGPPHLHPPPSPSSAHKPRSSTAAVPSRSEACPAPRRGLEGNRFAMLEHACVDGPPALQPPQSAPGKARTSTRAVPDGLANVGNTCFFNACIMAMLACSALKQLAATARPADVHESRPTSAPVIVASVLRRLALAHGTESWPTGPDQVKRLIGEQLYGAVGSIAIAGGWVRGQQQSAEEALSIMLGSLIQVHAAGTGGAAHEVPCGVRWCEYSGVGHCAMCGTAVAPAGTIEATELILRVGCGEAAGPRLSLEASLRSQYASAQPYAGIRPGLQCEQCGIHVDARTLHTRRECNAVGSTLFVAIDRQDHVAVSEIQERIVDARRRMEHAATSSSAEYVAAAAEYKAAQGELKRVPKRRFMVEYPRQLSTSAVPRKTAPLAAKGTPVPEYYY